MKHPRRNRIWIDLDNTPHVLFFRPIIPELEKRGYRVLVTARDAYQVSDVAALFNISHRRIGRHYGKNKLMKVLGTFIRALQLVPAVFLNRPALAVSHGSRSQHVAANALFIKSLDIYDYEHCATFFFTKTTWALAPEVVAHACTKHKARKGTLGYPGIKEDVYVPFFKPEIDVRSELGLGTGDIVVLVRPPATEAHYHNPEAEVILDSLIHAIADNNVKAIVVPRNKRQQEEIETKFPALLGNGTLVLPRKAYDGLLLIWCADLVVSGGGTMNREAAALGIPVYSIFRGKTGAVDRYLSSIGKLVFIEKPGDVKEKIAFVPRPEKKLRFSGDNPTLEKVITHIETLAR
jgi:uncharacterized protein